MVQKKIHIEDLPNNHSLELQKTAVGNYYLVIKDGDREIKTVMFGSTHEQSWDFYKMLEKLNH